MSDNNQQYGGIHISSVKDDDKIENSQSSQGFHIGNDSGIKINEASSIQSASLPNDIDKPKESQNFHIGNDDIKINEAQDIPQQNNQLSSMPSSDGGFHIGTDNSQDKDLTGIEINKNDSNHDILDNQLKDAPIKINKENTANQSGINIISQDLQKDENSIQNEVKLTPVKCDNPHSIEFLFDYARDNFASDLHVSTGSVPKIRLYGEIETVSNYPELTPDRALDLIHQTMTEELKQEYKEKLDVDYSFKDSNGLRYRCNAMMNINGPSGVFRIISDIIIPFEELGLPESLKKLEKLKKGMVLVTGPSGCGKSTTLATLVDMVNRNDEGHILTIEDPVEILHTSKKSLVNHREIKTHTKSFARALKSALREDPDCIMIGEMRDLETVSLALTAAETGHLVFGTLHTSSAAKTITRIIDVFPFGEQGQIRAMLSEGIQCVISQVLCRRKDGKGRVAAFEVMFGSDAIKNLIRSDKIFQINSAIEVGMKEGMQTLDQALKKLVVQNIIDIEEAKLYANYPEDL